VTEVDDAVDQLLALLARRRGVDFRDHRRAIIARGIAARLKASGLADLEQYAAWVDRDDAEADRLIAALVVPVSSFFRDPQVFEALETRVIPEQLARTAGPVRTWVVGAATGEEAWSWALLLAWCRERHGGPPVDVLGSDVNGGALAVARTGRYPAAASAAVADRFKKHLDGASGDEIVMPEGLRRRVLFAQHDLMGPRVAPVEAILASFQIVSFRNVLIYLNQRLRRKALERLGSVLKPEGVLVLGTVETLSPDLEGRFVPYPGTEPSLRIYRRVG
jgi:two-component system CheB/CheR fusion protein